HYQPANLIFRAAIRPLIPPPPISPLFPYTTLFRSILTFYKHGVSYPIAGRDELLSLIPPLRARYSTYADFGAAQVEDIVPAKELDRKSTRLNSSHVAISYAVFCLKKKNSIPHILSG